MSTDVTTTFAIVEDCNSTQDFTVGGVNPGNKANGAVNFNNTTRQFVTTSAPAAATIDGIGFDITSRDATNELVFISHAFNAPNRLQCDTRANNGAIFRLYSGVTGGSTDFRTYQVGGSDTARLTPRHLAYILNPNMAGDVESGTFDITDLQSFAVGVNEAVLFGPSNVAAKKCRASKLLGESHRSS